MKVSIILPTRNSQRTIKKCLEWIKKQSYKNIETIFVDNYSCDWTFEIWEQFKKQIDIKLFRKGPERNKQRPYWVQKANWGIYIFLDDDMYIPKDLVEEVVNIMEKNKSIGSLIIPEENIAYDWFWSKVRAFEKTFYDWDDGIESPRVFRKEVYKKVWWYNKKLISGEDWDLSNRVREMSKISRTKKKLLHDEWDIRLIELMKKKFYYWEEFVNYTKYNSFKNTLNKPFFMRKCFYTKYKMYFKKPILTFWLFTMLKLTLLSFWAWYIKWKLRK